MSKRQVLIILGFFIIILPFLGLPSDWKEIASVVLGLLVVFVSYRIRASPPSQAVSSSSMPYAEHKIEREEQPK